MVVPAFNLALRMLRQGYYEPVCTTWGGEKEGFSKDKGYLIDSRSSGASRNWY